LKLLRFNKWRHNVPNPISKCFVGCSAAANAERDREIIRNMKRKGYGIEAIAELTGSSHAEIERLD